MSDKKEKSEIGMKYAAKDGVDGVPEGTFGYVYFQYPDYKKPHKWAIAVIFENGIYEEFSFGVRGRYLERVKEYKSYAKYDFLHIGKVVQDFNKGYWKF